MDCIGCSPHFLPPTIRHALLLLPASGFGPIKIQHLYDGTIILKRSFNSRSFPNRTDFFFAYIFNLLPGVSPLASPCAFYSRRRHVTIFARVKYTRILRSSDWPLRAGILVGNRLAAASEGEQRSACEAANNTILIILNRLGIGDLRVINLSGIRWQIRTI